MCRIRHFQGRRSLLAGRHPAHCADLFAGCGSKLHDYSSGWLPIIDRGDGRTRAKRRYALVPRQAARPQLPPDYTLIRTPVQRVVTLASPFIGYLAAIDCIQSIVGVANADHIYHPLVQEQLQQGRTRSVQTGQSLNIEALLKLQPDLILCNGTAADALAVNPQLMRSGLPLVITTDYLEAHPLARAEWLRFVAAFLSAPRKRKNLQRHPGALPTASQLQQIKD